MDFYQSAVEAEVTVTCPISNGLRCYDSAPKPNTIPVRGRLCHVAFESLALAGSQCVVRLLMLNAALSLSSCNVRSNF